MHQTEFLHRVPATRIRVLAAMLAISLVVALASAGHTSGSTAQALPKPPHGLKFAKGCIRTKALSRPLQIMVKVLDDVPCFPPLKVKVWARIPATSTLAAANGVAWCTLLNFRPGYHPVVQLVSIAKAAHFCGSGQKKRGLGWEYVRYTVMDVAP